MQDAWNWVWGNIQSLDALIGLLILVGGAGFGRKYLQSQQPANQDEKPPAPSRDLKSLYYQSLDSDCEILKLNFVDKNLGQQQTALNLNLSKIYQDQYIRLPQQGDRKTENLAENKDPVPLMDALDKLDSKRLVILGKMGSGKSSFVNYLTHRIIQSRAESVTNLPSFMSNRPVVRLLLREIGASFDPKANSEGLLWRAIKAALHQQIEKRLEKSADPALQENEFEIFFSQFKQDFIKNKGVLLLDGLDEITRQSTADALHHSLLSFAADNVNKGILIIVTSRPEAYKTDEQKLSGFLPPASLEPMTITQIRTFIGQWYEVIENRDASQAENKAYDLAIMIEENPTFLELAQTPLQLTLLIGLHSAGKSLRGSLPEVYREMIDLLLLRWNENLRETLEVLSDAQQQGMKVLQHSPKALQDALQQVAYETYDTLDGKVNSKADANNIEFYDSIVIGKLDRALKDSQYDNDNLLDFLQNRCGILIAGNKTGKLQFVHKSFHEYLTAKHLFNEADWEQQITAKLVKNPRWWRKVFLFMAKDEADNRYGKAVAFLHNDVLGAYDPEDRAQQRLLVLAAVAAVEMSLHKNLSKPTHKNLHQSLTTKLSIVLHSSDLSLDERAEAGRLLGRLGDPREGVSTIKDKNGNKIPAIKWEAIPAGEFTMGFSEDEIEIDWDKQATPQHRVAVSAFKISRYPVTNAQYQCFIDAGGYDNESYWQQPPAALHWLQGSKPDLSLFSDLDKDDQKFFKNWLENDTERSLPYYWKQRKWNNPNHPVVGISWYEALAFCNWFNSVADLQEEKVSLPSEDQWEYAARSSQNLTYAWGDKADPALGNIKESGLERTTSVGLFAAGKAFSESQVQLYDMNGNVGEWTSSQWGKQLLQAEFNYSQWESQQQKRNQLDRNSNRVLRGGSWISDGGNCRSAYRYGRTTGHRNGNIGFRLSLAQVQTRAKQ